MSVDCRRRGYCSTDPSDYVHCTPRAIDAVTRLSMLECYRVHFFPEWFQTHSMVSVDVFRYPITNSTSETFTTSLILVQHTFAWYPDPNVDQEFSIICHQFIFHELIMSLPYSAKHKKPVCDKCTAGTNCTKCCLCQPCSRGRPRKDTIVASDSETAARSNLEREARIHHTTDASASSVLEETPAITDEAIQYASQAHILKVMGLMGCEGGYESSVRRLPNIDVRNQIQYVSELDAASVQQIENVFRRGIKALV